MGFRSGFISDCYDNCWPKWFVEKYKKCVWFNLYNNGSISSKYALKQDTSIFSELHTDIQKAINWDEFCVEFIIIYLHECGGVTRCEITKDCIKWGEPDSWHETDGVTHNYCYGCSSIK